MATYGVATITESSVQTEEFPDNPLGAEMTNQYSNIETQTNGDDLESMIHSWDDDDFFAALDMADIETQTYWNTDETTQTDFSQSSSSSSSDKMLDECLRNFGFIS